MVSRNPHSPTQLAQQTPPVRGLRHALIGGAAVALVAILVGGGLFGWLFLAARGPSIPELLPSDTQLYAALSPNLGGVVEREQLRAALRDGFGVSEPETLLPAVERLLGVPLEGNVGTWLGSEIAVAVRGFDAAAVQGENARATLLRDGEVMFFFGSKNDPQAAAFLQKVREAHAGRGEPMTTLTHGEVTIYTQVGGAPSPTVAFALIEHYVVFSNSRAALEALATRPTNGAERLTTAPGFAQFAQALTAHRTGLIYSDGSAAADKARVAVRELLAELEP